MVVYSYGQPGYSDLFTIAANVNPTQAAQEAGLVFDVTTGLFGSVITQVQFQVRKIGNPTGSMVATVRKRIDNSLVGVSTNSVDPTTIPASTITAFVQNNVSAGWQTLSFSFNNVVAPLENFMVLLEFGGGDGVSNYLRLGCSLSPTPAGVLIAYVNINPVPVYIATGSTNTATVTLVANPTALLPPPPPPPPPILPPPPPPILPPPPPPPPPILPPPPPIIPPPPPPPIFPPPPPPPVVQAGMGGLLPLVLLASMGAIVIGIFGTDFIFGNNGNKKK